VGNADPVKKGLIDPLFGVDIRKPFDEPV
jgi:hypothetical protein